MNISRETILNSISHLRTTSGTKNQFNCLTENKFWGLLCILKNIKSSEIKSGNDYWVYTSDIGDSLNDLFYFGASPKPTITRTKRWCIRFAHNWHKFVNENFLHSSPNIYAIACFIYKFDNFTTSINAKDLISKFLSDFHIPLNIAEEWFSFNHFNVSFDNHPLKPITLKSSLGQKNDTFSFDTQNGVVAKPSELSRAPFIQTLYAGMEIIKCMLISEEDLSILYPKNN